MQKNQNQYWFPRKRIGLGWGIPNTWQGWVVLAGYLLLLVGGETFIHPKPIFMIYITVCTALLVLVVWLKGEAPRQRESKNKLD
jgi:hypothetical protein